MKKPVMSHVMRAELNRAMKSLVTVLGGKFTAEEYGNVQDVYWEFEGGRRPVGDHVLASIQYNTKVKAMRFEVEGMHLNYKSKPCKTASELRQTIFWWARSQSGLTGVESNLLSKLTRVWAER